MNTETECSRLLAPVGHTVAAISDGSDTLTARLFMALPMTVHKHAAGDVLLGGEEDTVVIAQSGTAVSRDILSDGKRLVSDFAYSGNIFGSGSVLFSQLGRQIVAVKAGTHLRISGSELRRFIAQKPDMGNALATLAQLEEMAYRNRMLLVARADPLARISNFLLELFGRVRHASSYHNGRLASSRIVPFPYGQGVVADIVGLSSVHVSRTLTALTKSGDIARPARHLIDVLDEKKLLSRTGLEDVAFFSRTAKPMLTHLRASEGRSNDR